MFGHTVSISAICTGNSQGQRAALLDDLLGKTSPIAVSFGFSVRAAVRMRCQDHGPVTVLDCTAADSVLYRRKVAGRKKYKSHRFSLPAVPTLSIKINAVHQISKHSAHKHSQILLARGRRPAGSSFDAGAK